MDTAKIVRFAGFECVTDIQTYANGGPAIRLVEKGTHSPIATATSWIPGLKDGEVAIKDYSENIGMLDSLLAAGVITPPHRIENGMFPVAYIVKEDEEEKANEDWMRQLEAERSGYEADYWANYEPTERQMAEAREKKRHPFEHEYKTAIEVVARDGSHQVVCPECGGLIHEMEEMTVDGDKTGTWLPTSNCCSMPCGDDEYCVSYLKTDNCPCYT